jgi:hypothetical protein
MGPVPLLTPRTVLVFERPVSYLLHKIYLKQTTAGVARRCLFFETTMSRTV